MRKSESFIEDRIRWKLKEHKLPSEKTDFWDKICEKFSIELIPEVGNPVLVSYADDAHYIVLCIYGAIVKNDSVLQTIKYSDIDRVHDQPMKENEEKIDLTRLMIRVKSGETIKAHPEKGAPAFAVWSILLMMQRMS